MTATVQGMEGVVAGESAITWIDGLKGELRYRGFEIGELAESSTFEEVALLLMLGELPSATELSLFLQDLNEWRRAYAKFGTLAASLPEAAHPLDVLRYFVSLDSLENPLAWHNDRESNLVKTTQMLAWFPLVVASYHRARKGMSTSQIVEGTTAKVFLNMLSPGANNRTAIDTLDRSLILHADHELNASTFAARVTIATQSNLHAAIASALGTLAGPRHGGASDRVIRMLEAIELPANTEQWVMEQLGSRERIMGFGHRVYRTTDPRSRHLRSMAESLLRDGPHEHWIPILDTLALVMQRERGLYPNVDLFAAVVNHELGVDPTFYTSIFAMSRLVGWSAHALEQLDGRMIRPVAQYVGAAPRSRRATSAAASNL